MIEIIKKSILNDPFLGDVKNIKNKLQKIKKEKNINCIDIRNNKDNLVKFPKLEEEIKLEKKKILKNSNFLFLSNN